MTHFQAAATEVLAMTGPVAWESAHRTHALSVLQQFTAGQLDTSAVRAALGSSRDVGGSPAVRAKGVAVIPLVGVLTPTASLFTMLGCGTSLEAFGRQLRAAAADASVTSILILTDSPGGETGLVPETAALVRQIRAAKPIVAAVIGLDASAAYWITSNCTAIEATTSASVGAIGVYTVRASIARQLQAEGVDVEVISAGKFKSEGNLALPITDAERQAKQARVDEAYGGFVGDVAAGRGVPVSAVRNGFGEGRMVSATRAVQLGLIDAVALVDDTIRRALTSTGPRAWVSAEDGADRWRRRVLGLPVSPGLAPAGVTTARLLEADADVVERTRRNRLL